MTEAIDGFFVAPHVPNGELIGVGYWKRSQLSPKWLEVAGSFLESNGNSFRASWGAELSDVETRFTGGSTTAMCTFFVGGRIISSHLYLPGLDPAEEDEVLTMFIDSLHRSRSVIDAAEGQQEPFKGCRTIRERPLDLAVIWPTEAPRHELARELSTHLACAFFCGVSGKRPLPD